MSEHDKKCATCDRSVEDWPMAFRGDDTCSVLCDKKKQVSDAASAERAAEIGMTTKPKKKALVQMGADE